MPRGILQNKTAAEETESQWRFESVYRPVGEEAIWASKNDFHTEAKLLWKDDEAGVWRIDPDLYDAIQLPLAEDAASWLASLM